MIHRWVTLRALDELQRSGKEKMQKGLYVLAASILRAAERSADGKLFSEQALLLTADSVRIANDE